MCYRGVGHAEAHRKAAQHDRQRAALYATVRIGTQITAGSRRVCDNRLIDQLQWWLEFVVAMKEQGQANVVLAQWYRAVSR